jgi:hypothetical protein
MQKIRIVLQIATLAISSAMVVHQSPQTPTKIVSLQVWVEGPPKEAFVSVNGIGYTIKTSPLVRPNSPDNPIDVPINPSHPDTPVAPAFPVGSIELYAYEYLQAYPDGYAMVSGQVKSKQIKNHVKALEAIAASRETTYRKFTNAYKEIAQPLCDPKTQDIMDSEKYADLIMRCADGFRGIQR